MKNVWKSELLKSAVIQKKLGCYPLGFDAFDLFALKILFFLAQVSFVSSIFNNVLLLHQLLFEL